MILHLDDSGKILSVLSDQANEEENIGLLSGKNISILIFENETTKALAFLSEVLESNTVQSIVLNFASASGSERKRYCMGFPNSDNSITLLIRNTDFPPVVTEQSKAARERMSTLFNKLPIAMIILDRNGFVEAVNSTTIELFEYSSNMFSQLHVADLLKSGRQETRESFVEYILNNSRQLCRLDAFTKDGRLIPTEMFAQLMDSTGDRILLTIFDITERVQLEQMKQDFMHMISHDIRTPMANVSLFLQSISAGVCWDETKEEIENRALNTDKEVGRLLRLVGDLLSLDKLDSSAYKLSLERLLISELFQDARQSVEDLANERNISIVSDKEDLYTHADRDQIVRVLVNLLGNAIKYSFASSKISVRWCHSGNFVEVRVIDNGPGIAEDQRSRIFEKFEQLKADRERKDSSGLGLAICKSIVEAHGGEIGVDSTEGVGSQFWFRLPNKDA